MRWLAVVLMAGLAMPAAAQVADTAKARKDLYPTRGYDIRVSEGLSEKDARTVEAIVPLMAEQLRQPVRYYAAIAWSPSDGLVHESLQAAMNFHAPDAAAVAAVEACMPLRSAGAERPCAVAALVVPRKWVPKDVMLSLDATAAFDKAFRKARSPKSFAISRRGGAWGTGTSDAEALAAGAAGGAGDCAVVIRD